MSKSHARYLFADDLDSPVGGKRTGITTLPGELLHVIPGRLRILALIWAGFYGIALLLALFLELSPGFDGWPLRVNVTFVVVVVISLGVVAAVKKLRERPNPLVVPSKTLQTVIASSLSWLMLPLSLGLFAWLELTDPNPDVYFGLGVGGLLVILLAIIPQRFVYRLGRTVQRLKEMGSYKLEQRLGRGGMGEVWLAHHRMLARPAAIKLIRPDVDGTVSEEVGARLLARFEREAQSTAALRSPHTVGLYDFGVSRDGAFYYVMEHLAGVDLNALVDRFGPQPPERVIAILRQACHSLAEAHRAGLVHRDIKPANLMLCRYGDDLDFVKVLDFGMVKRTADRVEQDLTLTAEGTIAGTPAFMPPELATGGQPIDGTTDLYALGCVAYWLLTGGLLFDGATAAAMIIKHASEEPVPPSVRSEHEIPPELERIILKCLAKKPEERFAGASELAAALEGVEVPRPWSEDRARKWWDSHLPDVLRAPQTFASDLGQRAT